MCAGLLYTWAMDTLPAEVWLLIISFPAAAEYAPAIRATCRGLCALVGSAGLATPPCRLADLALRGDTSLLVGWLPRDTLLRRLRELVAAAAEGGQEPLLASLYQWQPLRWWQQWRRLLAIPTAELCGAALAGAARGGHHFLVRPLLANVPDDESCHRALAEAACGGHTTIMSLVRDHLLRIASNARFLREGGANNALSAAAWHGHLVAMFLCRSWGARVRCASPMIGAVCSGNAEVARVCHTWSHEDGVFVDRENLLACAAGSGQVEMLRLLCHLWGGPPSGWALALSVAAANGCVGTMRECRKAADGREVDAGGLMLAAVGGLIKPGYSADALLPPFKKTVRNDPVRVRKLCDAMRLCRGWGAANFDQALCRAAREGFIAAMRLCRDALVPRVGGGCVCRGPDSGPGCCAPRKPEAPPAVAGEGLGDGG